MNGGQKLFIFIQFLLKGSLCALLCILQKLRTDINVGCRWVGWHIRNNQDKLCYETRSLLNLDKIIFELNNQYYILHLRSNFDTRQ